MNLSDLQKQNISISLLGNDLDIRAAKGIVTPIILAEIKQHKPVLIQALRLTDYQQKAKATSSLAELFALLKDFSKHNWNICQQSDMSAAYTSHAIRLIESEQTNKWHVLEDLACLCWKGSAT